MKKAESSTPVKSSQIECVLDFCVDLSRRMIVSGANLERVKLAVERICHAYKLHDISISLLSTYISLAARDAEGRYASRQGSIPAAGIQLEQLKNFNRLSYYVVENHPAPSRLNTLLEEVMVVKDYSDWVVLLAQICAMSCLCLIFGGGFREVLCVLLITAEMHGLLRLMARPGLDRTVTNAITMWAATATAILLMAAGVSADGTVILITVSMLVIPGIPLVNAVRNLLCGNEMNGILQLLKVTIETLSLAMGIYLSILMFGRGYATGGEIKTSLTDPILLILLSFLASTGFGVVFRIPRHDLWRAGLGGALTRIALILTNTWLSSRMACVTIAALFASLYAELLATKRKDPSTYFVYPAIIPLIPGDLFYYAIEGLYAGDWQMFRTNGQSCLLTLFAMSIGFVISSIIAHYVRKMRHRRLVNPPST